MKAEPHDRGSQLHDDPPDSGRRPATSDDHDSTPAHVVTAVAAAEDLKAEALKLLDLAEVSDFTDYFLIMSGRSDRQVQAIGQAIDRRLRKQGIRPLHREGLREGKWILLDYGDLVVHVFDEDRRDFYRLDLLWSDAPEIPRAAITDRPAESGEASRESVE